MDREKIEQGVRLILEGIGETTVKTHVSHILRKLGQSDRTQAVIMAVKANLVRLED